MFEREGRREKILEARNREIKLKLALEAKASGYIVKEGVHAEEEEESEEEVEAGALFLQDPAIIAATEEFNAIIYAETKGPEAIEEEELPEEPVVEEEPPPPEPEPEPAPVEKEKGKKGKKKGKKK